MGPAHDPDGVAVLLIEDDPEVLEMYKLRLERDGYTVNTARDGQAGLQCAFDTLPDLVFLDIRLPRKDGFAVLAELRGDPRTAHIPVIILTNYGEKELKERGKQMGANEYLIKSSTSPSRLSSGISEWMDD